MERLLADRTISLDLVVYTPEELRRLFAAGNPFIEEVIEHGRVLYMRKVTAAWLREAQDELETAIVLRALLWIPCLSGLPQLTVLLANGRVELAGQYRAVRAGSARARLRGTFFRMASRAQRTLARASPPAGRVPPAGEHAPDSSQPTCRPAAMMVQ